MKRYNHEKASREYKVPCGATIGHGQICVAGAMRGGCTEIARLRGIYQTTFLNAIATLSKLD
jgi:hypothetical protein